MIFSKKEAKKQNFQHISKTIDALHFDYIMQMEIFLIKKFN